MLITVKAVMKRFIPPFLLLIGGFLVLSAFGGRIDVLSEDVVVPPYGFMEWSLNLSRGAKINVVTNTEIDINDTCRIILVVFIMDEQDFSNYVSENLSLIHLSPSQRIRVEAYGTSWWYPYRVPHRGRWHVVLDNKHVVSDRDKEKPVHINVYVTTPYRYLQSPGVALLSIGLASMIWQNRDFLRIVSAKNEHDPTSTK